MSWQDVIACDREPIGIQLLLTDKDTAAMYYILSFLQKNLAPVCFHSEKRYLGCLQIIMVKIVIIFSQTLSQ